ncbi:PKD domain-containing protein [Larkinella terrae]|uniref:PKD domain-containing protein n=1 Tax=Larkinella terrae TaxID=2025311 RepID=A0A7K0ENE0_9BACT|nr:PKD domain-containing protein [Larkinella terrae]
MKSLSTSTIILIFVCLLGVSLLGCEWELPASKTLRDCGKPAGSLDAQIQQKDVNFSVTGSTGKIDKVTWDFGNGSSTVTSGLTVSYSYPSPGEFSVRAILSNSCLDETILSRTVMVQDAAYPSVSLQPAFDITINTATIGMTITSAGNAEILSYGICYSSTNQVPERGKSDVLVLQNIKVLPLNTPVSFTPTNLTPNTLYYVRSFATNQEGIGYSSTVQTFRTGSKPAVSSMGAVNVGVSTAGARFMVTNAGMPAAIEYGICYSSTNTLPDINNSPYLKVANPIVGTNVTVSLTDLTSNTRYYYRSYAKLASGEVIYSPTTESFTTQVDALAQDLVASVSFTDGSRLDVSGNNNDVKLVDNPTFVADRKGRVNSAIQLDGQNDYFYMDENATLRPAELSISLWIRPVTVDRWMQIYNKSRFSDGANEMYSSAIHPSAADPGLVVSADIKQNSTCQRGAGWQTIAFTGNIQQNAWHHLVMTYSGRLARMYFDNVLVVTSEILPRSAIDECLGGDLKFGAQSQSVPNYFDGAMDDIRVYKRALTASDIQALYTQ